jgi:hypothetical protein
MIIETVVTTLNEDGSVNLAPMGPVVDTDWSEFELRPFETSSTLENLKRSGQGIVHITDDVELIVRAATHQLLELPALEAGRQVDVPAICGACRWFEFRVESIIELIPRVSIRCRTVYEHRNRDFIGFNRAKNAVLEAAILATRLDFLPLVEVVEQYRRYETVIEKTGGDQERDAFELLKKLIERLQANAQAK